MTELDEKTERLTRLAHEQQLDGVVLASQPGFAWLTGGGTNRIDGSRENGSGALFVRADGQRFVIANEIEMPRLIGEELAEVRWEPLSYPWAEEHANPSIVKQLASSAVGPPKSGTPRIGADWPLAGCVAMDAAIARLRALLTPAEANRYRALGSDAGRVIGDVARAVKPGMREAEIARRIHNAAAEIGGRATVVLVAADDRITRFRHPVPTTRVWTRLVMLVTCIQRQGLVVALSRIVSSGPPEAELMRRTEATAHVFARLLEASRPGARGRDLFTVAQRAYRDVGFEGEERRHHQGGAIGYRSREWVAHPASDELVQAAQAFAWNPSVTGTKVEDTALLTDDGIELITSSGEWPTIEVAGHGRTYAAPGILVL